MSILREKYTDYSQKDRFSAKFDRIFFSVQAVRQLMIVLIRSKPVVTPFSSVFDLFISFTLKTLIRIGSDLVTFYSMAFIFTRAFYELIMSGEQSLLYDRILLLFTHSTIISLHFIHAHFFVISIL